MLSSPSLNHSRTYRRCCWGFAGEEGSKTLFDGGSRAAARSGLMSRGEFAEYIFKDECLRSRLRARAALGGKPD